MNEAILIPPTLTTRQKALLVEVAMAILNDPDARMELYSPDGRTIRARYMKQAARTREE